MKKALICLLQPATSMAKYLPVLLILLSSACKKDNTKVSASLKNASGVVVGTALSYDLLSNEKYMGILKEQFSRITPENETKMLAVWPGGPGTPKNFSQADALYNYAMANGMKMHGHVLSWYLYDQNTWLGTYQGSAADLEIIYREYILEMMARYPQIRSWDVVNEAINDPLGNSIGGPFVYKFRDHSMQRILGDDFLFKVFSWAAEANPTTDLFYNDYNLILYPDKLDKVLEVCDHARSLGAKIDGIGFQAHLFFPGSINYNSAYLAFKKVADRGYKVHVSEMDVPINGPFGNCDQPPQVFFSNDTVITQTSAACAVHLDSMAVIQKERYYDVVKAYLDAVPTSLQHGVTVWGFSDCCNWYANAAPWLLGSKDWPAIYNSLLEPKPGYYSMLNALSGK